MSVLATATLYATRKKESSATPIGTTGDGEKKADAPVAANALMTAIGGEVIATSAIMAMPAHIDTETTGAGGGIPSMTDSPNQVQRTPTPAR